MKEEYKLFVGNLSYTINNDQLFDLFSAIEGVKVADATVLMDRETGQPRGFGFVKVEEKPMLDLAIEAMNGKEIEGRAIIVNVARPQGDRNDGGSRGGFGNRGGGGGGYGRR